MSFIITEIARRFLDGDDWFFNITEHGAADSQIVNASNKSEAEELDSSTVSAEGEEVENSSLNDGESLRNTFLLYGSLFLFLMIIFCFVRRRFPKVYVVRNWIPQLKCDLASDQYGWVSWTWRLLMVPEQDILDQCGMDALCFLRILTYGFKVSVVGIINSFWLMPIYAMAPSSDETDYADGTIGQLSAIHVPSSNGRLICTTVASYIVFGYAMRLLLKDFEWFTAKRHQFLSKTLPRNYTVYVSGICREYRSSARLLKYFRDCYSDDNVLEANVVLDIPQLEQKVANRKALAAKLEHAIAVQESTGVAPTHKSSLIGGEAVNSIERYKEEVRQLNEEIQQDIANIRALYETDIGDNRGDLSPLNATLSESDSDDSVHEFAGTSQTASEDTSERRRQGLAKVTSSVTTTVSKGIKHVGTSTLAFIMGDDDGKPREAGFVTFSNLGTTNSSMQMMQNPAPFTMEVTEAPDPRDILWNNVGMTHKQLQTGNLVSFSLTCLFCLFWTFPVSFVASLSAVDALKQSLPFLQRMVDAFPATEQFLAQLAPLLMVGLHAILPFILLGFCRMEGKISSSLLETSLFVKFAAFMIIQTFFVGSISGSIFQAVSDIVKNPAETVDYIAISLASQSTYFVQIILVTAFVGLSVELLQVGRVLAAWIRSMTGPNLTEKERNSSLMGLNPLSEPNDFNFGIVLGQAVLYYMVAFVYASMVPICNYFVALCYLLSSIAYRHQFIYIYPDTKDSGGKLWTRFVGIAITCMIIAEFVVAAWLGIKKAPVATGLMVPLIVITFLFSYYIHQQHFRVTNHLTCRECRQVDLKNMSGHEPMDFGFVRGAYCQPALKSQDYEPRDLAAPNPITTSHTGDNSSGIDSFDVEIC